MAEAAVQEEQLPNKFFCHQCKVEINPKIPEYTCPRCDNGFIEEIEESLDEPDIDQDTTDPAAQFAELWGRTFLESFRLYSDSNRASDDADADSPSENEDVSGARPQNIRVLPGRISIRRNPAGMGPGQGGTLQSIIEQLLSGLTGGAMMGAGRGGAIPIGFNLPMYGNPGDYAWGSGGLDNIISQLLNQLEGTGPPPAPKDQIDRLKSFEITQIEVDKNVQCSVCMEDFKLEERVKELPCNHLYHPDCIVPWLEMHGTCPICRKTLDGNVCDEHGNPVGSESANGGATPGPSDSASYSGNSSSANNYRGTSNNNSRQPHFEEEYD